MTLSVAAPLFVTQIAPFAATVTLRGMLPTAISATLPWVTVSNADTLPWRGTAAGGGLSTTGDLARFATALLDGSLLSKRLFEQATTAQAPGSGYGFGFGVAGTGSQRRFGHGGGAPGMNGELMVFPASRTIIVALANLDPPVASRLAEFYANRMPVAD